MHREEGSVVNDKALQRGIRNLYSSYWPDEDVPGINRRFARIDELFRATWSDERTRPSASQLKHACYRGGKLRDATIAHLEELFGFPLRAPRAEEAKVRGIDDRPRDWWLSGKGRCEALQCARADIDHCITLVSMFRPARGTEIRAITLMRWSGIASGNLQCAVDLGRDKVQMKKLATLFRLLEERVKPSVERSTRDHRRAADAHDALAVFYHNYGDPASAAFGCDHVEDEGDAFRAVWFDTQASLHSQQFTQCCDASDPRYPHHTISAARYGLNAALWQVRSPDYGRADRMLKDYEQRIGPDINHFDEVERCVLQSERDMIRVRGLERAGQICKTIPILESIVDARERVFGSTHHIVLGSKMRLAVNREGWGSPSLAKHARMFTHLHRELKTITDFDLPCAQRSLPVRES